MIEGIVTIPEPMALFQVLLVMFDFEESIFHNARILEHIPGKVA